MAARRVGRLCETPSVRSAKGPHVRVAGGEVAPKAAVGIAAVSKKRAGRRLGAEALFLVLALEVLVSIVRRA
jgi:hypothetical protein